MSTRLTTIRTFLVICGVSAIALAAQAPAPSRPEQALIDDLVLANRMLASEELGFLDAYGHVSVRSRTNPGHFLISRYVSPGIVTASDIIENDLDSKPARASAPTSIRSGSFTARFTKRGRTCRRTSPRRPAGV